MKPFALAAMLAVAVLLAGSPSGPAQAQRGAYWYPGGGPTTGGMYRKSDKKKTRKASHKKTHK
jgi:hypothetical protein